MAPGPSTAAPTHPSGHALMQKVSQVAVRDRVRNMPGVILRCLREVSDLFQLEKDKPMSRMNLALADTIVTTALAKARDMGFAPLTVAVLDAGGHLTAFKREDRSGILRFDIAFGKAWGALGMGFGSRELAARAQSAPAFVNAITVASGGRVVPVPSGVLVIDAEGEVIGAVGISGDTSDNDEMCAVAGIEAGGMRGQTGADKPGANKPGADKPA